MPPLQATEKGLHPSKKNTSTSKHEISSLLVYLWVIFSLLDPVQPSRINSDPDPQHCTAGSPDLRAQAARLREAGIKCLSFAHVIIAKSFKNETKCTDPTFGNKFKQLGSAGTGGKARRGWRLGLSVCEF
jgi:hypothetical protein